jgi:hypothetical protein
MIPRDEIRARVFLDYINGALINLVHWPNLVSELLNLRLGVSQPSSGSNACLLFDLKVYSCEL